ncbi:hypothetical protein KY312_00150, partial [Candidatus Woesearchaeota archaeon]|nr:hypothetical protein [Candidatus Woesearchaeota archaeon]
TEEGIDCGGVCKLCPVIEEPVVQEPISEPEVQLPVTLPAPVCQPFEWPFWILYVFILLLSYFTIYRFRQVKKKLKQVQLLKILIVSNIVLFVLVLLDTLCSFRWYMAILLAVIFLTIVYLDKVYLEFKKKIRK